LSFVAVFSRARRFGVGRLSKCWLVATMLLAGTAGAGPDGSHQTIVVLVPEAAPPLPLQRLTEALRSQLVELGIRVQLSTGPATVGEHGEPGSGERDVLAFVWIERTGEALEVRFYEPAGASLRERRIPVAGTDAASVEEVAVVVRSAASALLERRRAKAAEPPPPPPSGPPPRPPSKTPPPVGEPEKDVPPLQASLAYAATLYAKEGPWQHGAIVSIAWRAGSTPWRFGAAYTWLPPLRHAADDWEISLSRHPIEAFVGLELAVAGPRVTLRAEGAGIYDPIVRRTSRVSAELESTPSTVRWSWATSMRLRLAWEPASRVWLFGGGGADFVVNRFENAIRDPEETTVLSPLLVRPRLQVGVAADLP
jgi:hypothetical protein